MPKFIERFRGPSITSLFTRYRLGDISTQDFKTEMGRIFPQVLQSQSFEKNWNVQCDVSEFTRKGFQEIRALQKKGIDVYLLSGTNALHIEHIEKEAGAIPGKRFFSFEQHKLEKDLFLALLDDIHKKHPSIHQKDILLFYTQPQAPTFQWNIFSWLIAKWFYRQAQGYVRALTAQATQSKRFELFQFSPKKESPNIVEQLKIAGLINYPKKPAQLQPIALTYRRSERLRTKAKEKK